MNFQFSYAKIGVSYFLFTILTHVLGTLRKKQLIVSLQAFFQLYWVMHRALYEQRARCQIACQLHIASSCCVLDGYQTIPVGYFGSCISQRNLKESHENIKSIIFQSDAGKRYQKFLHFLIAILWPRCRILYKRSK